MPEDRKRIKKIEVMVADTVRETHDTTTLILFTGNDTLDYKPGHFVTIDPHQLPALERWIAFLEDQKGKKEPPRAYSLYSAPHEKYLAITVKEERYQSGLTKYPPLLSPILVHRLQRGARLELTGFTGPYTLPDDIEDRTDHLVHICAGSGVVPNVSIIKHALHHGMKLRHTLLYGNKTWNDTIYRRDIEQLEREYPAQFKVVHALTRESSPSAHPGTVVKGRVNEELIRGHVAGLDEAEFFVCGPAITKHDRAAAAEKNEEPAPRFMETVLGGLEEIGISKSRIHRESYG